MREALLQNQITAGHARAILSINSRRAKEALFKKVLMQNLSVRQTEQLASEHGVKRNKTTLPNKSPDIEALENKLMRLLDAKVSIKQNGKHGLLTVRFNDLKDLNRIITILENK